MTLIGITTYREPADYGVWREIPCALIPHAYVAHVEAAGATAVLIPPRLDADEEWAQRLLGRLDGLVLAGGVDVEPARYGSDPHPSIQSSRPERDTSELALARASAALDMPTLGICRGMQVMAVERHGVLNQHLPDSVGHDDHSIAPGQYNDHVVRLTEGSLAHRVLGDEVTVPSYHHQAVETHPGYAASGWADDDTLEALEDPAAAFRLAVQWHPEVGEDDRLFVALVRAARAFAGG